MTRTILVVDDELLFRERLRKFPVGRGCRAVEAHDGDHALSVYKQERPDVVLLDVRMPGKDGLETLRDLQAFDPAVSVLMVTAAPEEERVRQAKDEGALSCLTKPVDPDSLDRVLRAIRGQPGSQKERRVGGHLP